MDNFTGTSGADTFTADNSVNAVTSSADALNGGGGTDTLNIFSAGAAFNVPALTSIETLNVYDQDADQSIASSNFASVTAANFIRGDGKITYTVGANVANVSLSDMVAVDTANTGGAIVVALAAAATSVTLGLNKITANATDTDENVSVTGANLATVTVNTTGTASSFDSLVVGNATAITLNAGVATTVTSLETGATAASLTIAGSGAVSLGTLDSAINTVTATTATGALTAAIGAEVDTVITLGSGNDVITASTTDTLVTANALSVNAGDGTDILVIGDANDINTAADGARYTNFETIRVAADQNVGLIAGITAVQVDAATSATVSGLTAAAAADIVVRGDQATDLTLTLASSAGSSDSVTVNLASATPASNVDVVGLSVIGVESLTINATTGTNATTFANAGTSDVAFLNGGTTKLTSIAVTGSKDVSIATANIALAVNINASESTGDFAISGNLATGSTVTGTDKADSLTLSTVTGTTYNGGAGKDTFTAGVADLVATGTNDNKVNGGADADTLTISTTAATLTDNHFTFVTGMEKLTTSTGSTSITTGGAFNSAFADSLTITTGTLVDTSTFTYAGGLYANATTVTIDGASLVGNGASEDVTVSTGSGADTVTFTGAAWVGGTLGDGGTIAISTGAGDDTISVTVDTLITQATSQAIVITGGAGADTITKVGVNGTTASSTASFVVAAGDSTAAALDKITGFDLGTAAILADSLDFDGTSNVASTFSATVDFGTILSHSVTAGVVTFDDAAAFSAAIVVNATNLTDVLGYLAANTATNDVVAFTYDSDANGSADATMVFHNGVTDSLVQLVGVLGTSLDATNATTAGLIAIA